MTSYRRHREYGGTYFFTVVIANRNQDLLVRHIDKLKCAIHNEQKIAPFEIIAWVVLPDHLHMMWKLPRGDVDFSNRWRRIKCSFSRSFLKSDNVSHSRVNKGERGIWQRRFWEHLIRDDNDLQKHLDYIHFNPVKHGYVTKVIDWPHSSFHSYVWNKTYPPQWGGGEDLGDFGDFGEIN